MTAAKRFISRLALRREPGSLGTIARLVGEGLDPGRAHRVLWTLFADADGAASRDREFLFRLGSGPRSPDGDALVVSLRQPVDRHALWRIETKPYELAFTSGQKFAFKLRANPTVTREGRRHDVVMDRKRALGAKRPTNIAEIWEEAGRDWLCARAARLGFTVLGLKADAYRVHRIPRPGAAAPVSFASLDLSGRLRVEDPAKLRAALVSGVGHGKAWGCGLLLVKPG